MYVHDILYDIAILQYGILWHTHYWNMEYWILKYWYLEYDTFTWIHVLEYCTGIHIAIPTSTRALGVPVLQVPALQYTCTYRYTCTRVWHTHSSARVVHVYRTGTCTRVFNIDIRFNNKKAVWWVQNWRKQMEIWWIPVTRWHRLYNAEYDARIFVFLVIFCYCNIFIDSHPSSTLLNTGIHTLDQASMDIHNAEWLRPGRSGCPECMECHAIMA